MTINLRDFVKKAITDGEWYVAYKSVDNDLYAIAEMPDDQWCADPFVYEVNGHHYIFVEQYLKNKLKGCIGYFEFIKGIPVNKGIIIENSYHMSYPNVFEYDRRYYMIPETSANSTVDLYIADHFPDKWHKVKSLIMGEKYVDSTVYQNNGQYYLFSYSMSKGYELHIFELDMEKQAVRLLSKKRYSKNVARPGGRLFVENGMVMRPAQDCSRKYGEALIIYQVDDINKNGDYLEHEVKRIESSTLGIDILPDRIHHITADDNYIAVDVYKEKIDLLHAFKIFIRSKRK